MGGPGYVNWILFLKCSDSVWQYILPFMNLIYSHTFIEGKFEKNVFVVVTERETLNMCLMFSLIFQHFWFAGLAAAGWLLGNLRHLVSSGGTSQGLSRRPERDALSYHLFVDVFFMLTGTLFFFGFGELTLKNLVSKSVFIILFQHCPV